MKKTLSLHHIAISRHQFLLLTAVQQQASSTLQGTVCVGTLWLSG